MATRIGFDVGGTFVDFVLATNNRIQRTYKHPNASGDLSSTIIEGLADFLDLTGTSLDEVDQLIHATTVATNTVLERKGRDTALLVTEGFKDVPILGRQKRHQLYNLFETKTRPIVPRNDVYEVPERYHPREGVVRELDRERTAEIVDDIADQYESVGVSLLHSYEFDRHEQVVEELIADRTDLFASRASNLSGTFREYERTNTAAVDAYVKPAISRYLSTLVEYLDSEGYEGSFYMVKSNGGAMTSGMVRERPVQIIESGPAAGALNSTFLSDVLDRDRVLSFDMGGTTAKSCYIVDGEPRKTDSFEIDKQEMRSGSGLPINLPAIDMIEIGAGGGSIASVDETGTISVGPESAGSDPGPICYGRGGSRPTVTDADLVLGYLNPAFFHGGEMELDVEAAREGIRREVAEPLELSVEDAAWGIKKIVDNSMTQASQIHAAERGLDLRRFEVIAFGGAGPAHAAHVAGNLNVPKVIVPAAAGVASAIGLLTADVEFHLTRTHVTTIDEESIDAIDGIYRNLERRGRNLVDRVVTADTPSEVVRSADLKYRRQAHDISVDIPSGGFDATAIPEIVDAFHEQYESMFGYSDRDETVEGVNWRVTVRQPTEAVEQPGLSTEVQGSDPSKGTRMAYFERAGEYVETDVYDWRLLPQGFEAEGPVIVEDVSSTALVPPGDVLRVDEYANLLLTIEQ